MRLVTHRNACQSVIRITLMIYMIKHGYDCVGGPLSPFRNVSHDRRRGVKRPAATRHTLETFMCYTCSMCSTCKAKRSQGFEGEKKWGERVEGWVVRRMYMESPVGGSVGILDTSAHLLWYSAVVRYRQAAVIYRQAHSPSRFLLWGVG